QGADAVDVLVEDRLLEARPHAGPGREMHNRGELAPREEGLHQLFVPDLALDQQVVRPAHELLDVAPLARRVVEIVEVVEHRDALALAEQPPGQMRSDETGAAGDQDMMGHALILSNPEDATVE